MDMNISIHPSFACLLNHYYTVEHCTSIYISTSSYYYVTAYYS